MIRAMRPRQWPLQFVIAALLGSCGTLNVAAVKVGDTKDHVSRALGAPVDRQSRGSLEAWQYCVSGAGFGWNDHRIVWFQGDRVTGVNSYRSNVTGCEGGLREVRWEQAPDATVEIRVR